MQPNVFDNFTSSLEELKESTPLTRPDKIARIISQVDILSLSREGLSHLYEISGHLVSLGFFQDTVWDETDKLVPALVHGTIKAGHPSSSFEIVSELRILGIARQLFYDDRMSASEAQSFLEEVMVHNLEFALNELKEETRNVMSSREIKKAHNLFGFIMSEIDLDGVYDKLTEEVEMMAAQRPIVTTRIRELIALIIHHTGESKSHHDDDHPIQIYINALNRPSRASVNYTGLDQYQHWLENEASEEDLEAEAEEMGRYMVQTGLVSQYHALLLLHLLSTYPSLIPSLLHLSDNGRAEWNQYYDFLSAIIAEIVDPYNIQCIYGFSMMLNRNIFSRRAVRIGLENLRRIKIHPRVGERIIKSVSNPQSHLSPLQYLMGGVIKVLGQPLGIGQGNNPTCQSARGISMWSQHAPAKLLDMIITVATQNNLVLRFENQNLESELLGKGLVQELDYNLDVVSVVLVPHLDRIYNEMMRLSTGRIDDPHRWVNPALYGQWIQVGFASCYDYASNSILDFNGFIRIFYAAFHPNFNGDRHIVYPVPVGIFITSNKGEMLGFHAISLLRVEKDNAGIIRAYFLNPNNEGRQDWGQGIKPTVNGNMERPGESSLPFDQFAARIYAFHYNQLEVNAYVQQVPETEILKVKTLARESWGKSYFWNDQIKIW